MIMENSQGKCELIFTKDAEAIRANDLQGFIFYFNIIYLKLLDDGFNINDYNNSDNIFNLELLKERCLKINFSKGEYQKYARKVYDDSNNLLIEELDKHSPLLILFSGAIIAILGASIVCDINVELSTTSTTTTSFSSTTTTKTTNVKININFNGDISTLVENTKNLVMGKK